MTSGIKKIAKNSFVYLKNQIDIIWTVFLTRNEKKTVSVIALSVFIVVADLRREEEGEEKKDVRSKKHAKQTQINRHMNESSKLFLLYIRSLT